jgi:hypothetical protein
VARDFIKATSARQRTGKTLRAHRWELLTYDGLPWRGELWLESELRLGPPSKHPTDALLGPQVLIVDAMVEGIGQRGVNANFQTRLHELRVFLSVVLGLNITSNKVARGWVSDVDEQLRIRDCRFGHVGYVETTKTPEFPSIGTAPPIERREATRPGLGPTGIWPDMHEQWVPTDIEELWRTFIRLPVAKRDHFLRAGNAHRIARSMWPEQRTAYASFLVVACEALKPIGKRYDNVNVYDVVASLLSSSEAEQLRKHSARPQALPSRRTRGWRAPPVTDSRLLRRPIIYGDAFRTVAGVSCVLNRMGAPRRGIHAGSDVPPETSFRRRQRSPRRWRRC